MAINVNAVYTTVLSILNKEQRGYLTPYEFGQIATQVQLEIFEKFFEDYNQYLRMPKTDVEFASRMDHIREEFQIFEKNENASAVSSNIYSQPTDLNRFGSASWNIGKNSPPIEIVSNRDYNKLKLSPLTQPTNDFPVGKYQQDKLTVFPSSTPSSMSDVTFNYIRKPKDVRWGYFLGNLGQYIYDNSVYGENTLNNNISLSNITTPLANGIFGVYNPTFTSSNLNPGSFSVSANVTAINNVLITLTNQGSGFKPGDTITINNDQLGLGSTGPTITLLESYFNGESTYGSTNFEISESQQTEVVLEILKYAGLVIRDPQVIQVASQELQQEEINSKR